jgi:3'-phosphoadenosine 5'-phosphosulfate sulfotransferase (PAPS reductase)/FAD synthetase
MRLQHIIPISGGKDSAGTACLAVERFHRRGYGNLPPRFVHCDVGKNEHQATVEHVAYLDQWLRAELGVGIEIIRADFAEQLAYRRANIRDDWSREKTLFRHSAECKAITAEMGWTAARDHRRICSCKRIILPPVDPELIAKAEALLQPTGDPFLDLCMLKGRFPGAKSRFCTEELKLAPMTIIKQAIWAEGISTVEWIGERADESPARALKPALQRIRHPGPLAVSQFLYRPVHGMTAADMFSITERHGLKPNPLYLMGAKRVGCWPCVLCGKDELINIANRTPDHIDRLREWELLVSEVSRRQCATFFPSADVPGGDEDWALGKIDERVRWARTGHGGRQLDLLRAAEMYDADRDGLLCDSAYGLCE